jgi:hypothetical protein
MLMQLSTRQIHLCSAAAESMEQSTVPLGRDCLQNAAPLAAVKLDKPR